MESQVQDVIKCDGTIPILCRWFAALCLQIQILTSAYVWHRCLLQNKIEEEALAEGEEEGGDALDFSEGEEEDSEGELSGTLPDFSLTD